MITSLKLTNYRSYTNHRYELHPNVTIVVGPNATGKTNFLEALYVLANTKSFRAKDADLIRHGADFFRLEVVMPESTVALGYQTQPQTTKQIHYDRVKRPLVRHVGTIPTVLFEPGDLMLLTGPPALRRRYLDGILSQTNLEYRQALDSYQKNLKQRNRLLERFDMARVKEQIFAWDLNLATNAAIVVAQRRRLLGTLNLKLPRLYQNISGQLVELSLNYLPSLPEGDDYATAFMNTLVTNLTRDMAAGFTTIGPHREDFTANFKGAMLAAEASRGENRSVVLALKLAELELLSGAIPPLLLLDDVFSELDSDRRKYLISQLGAYQSVITTTDADVAQSIGLDHTIIKTTDQGSYAAD